MPYMISNHQHPKVRNMHYTNGNTQTMDQQNNGLRKKYHLQYYQNIDKNKSKKVVG